MLKKVAVVLFAARTPTSQPCDKLLLERTESGQPSFVLPSVDVDPGELPTQAAARIAANLGCNIPSASWELMGLIRDESTVVFTATVPAKVFQDLPVTKRFRIDSAQMWVCEAWVNPAHYEPDFLQVLAEAHAVHHPR